MASGIPDEINPFRAPTAAIGAPALGGAVTDAESIRLAHLKHEASVRSVGTLAYCATGFLALLGLFYAAMAAGMVPGMVEEGGSAALGRLMGVVGGGFCLLGVGLGGGTGFGLRRLQAWARWVTLVVAVLLVGFALLGLVMAALINAMVALAASIVYAIPLLLLGVTIYLMASPRSNEVFSEAYREVVRQTPHIRYRAGLLVRILVGLLVGIIGLFAVLALIGGVR